MKFYVGTTCADRGEANVEYGPPGTIAVVDVPDDARVIGMYDADGRLYVEWVAEV